MSERSADASREPVAPAIVWATTLAASAALALFFARYPPAAAVLPELSAPAPEKLAAAARTLACLVAVNLAALGVASPLRGLTRDGAPGVAIALRLTFGLFALAHGVLLLGLAHALSTPALVALLVASGALGLPAALAALRRRGAGARPLRFRPSPAQWAIAVALALPLLAVFVPLYGWDALTYHLALPERFLREGSLAFSRFSLFTTVPLLTEMLYTLALALDGPALAKALHLELAALLLLALAASAGRHGRRAELFAVLCLLACPLFLWETGVVYSDLPLALVCVLALDAATQWERSGDRALVLRAALLCGLAAAIRYQGAAVALALGAAVVFGGGRPLRQRLAFAAALAAGALACLAPWLLRNLAATGDPLARAAFDPVFLSQMAAFHESVGMGRGFFALLAAPWNLTFRTSPDVYTGSFGFQIGPLYFVALLFGLAGGLRRPEAALPLRAALVLFVAWFSSSQEARFLFPTLVALSLAGAVGWERLLASSGRSARALLLALPLAAALANQVDFWNRSGATWRAALGDLPWREIERAEPLEHLGDVLRAEARPDLRVLPLFESRAWHLRGVDSIAYQNNEAAPVLIEIHRALAERRLCRWLAEERVTHVVVTRTPPRGFRPMFVAGYAASDFEDDLRRLAAFLGTSARVRARAGDSALFELLPAAQCREVD